MRQDVIVKAARMILIAQKLRRRPTDFELLAKHLETSPRNARRYLEALEYAGWVWPQETEA
jgi:predicted DNA-binding transcriptional regulator YafY